MLKRIDGNMGKLNGNTFVIEKFVSDDGFYSHRVFKNDKFYCMGSRLSIALMSFTEKYVKDEALFVLSLVDNMLYEAEYCEDLTTERFERMSWVDNLLGKHHKNLEYNLTPMGLKSNPNFEFYIFRSIGEKYGLLFYEHLEDKLIIQLVRIKRKKNKIIWEGWHGDVYPDNLELMKILKSRKIKIWDVYDIVQHEVKSYYANKEDIESSDDEEDDWEENCGEDDDFVEEVVEEIIEEEE